MDGLMTFCHDARKGRYIGSHWPNHVAPPLYSTSTKYMTTKAYAQPNFTGTITTWKGGSPTSSPQSYALADTTIVVGTNLVYKTGQSGMDEVRGKMFGTSTDLQGRFSLALPPGTYMVLVWKAGYTPQVDKQIVAPGVYNQSIAEDKSMQGLHKMLSYPGPNDPQSQ